MTHYFVIHLTFDRFRLIRLRHYPCFGTCAPPNCMHFYTPNGKPIAVPYSNLAMMLFVYQTNFDVNSTILLRVFLFTSMQQRATDTWEGLYI